MYARRLSKEKSMNELWPDDAVSAHSRFRISAITQLEDAVSANLKKHIDAGATIPYNDFDSMFEVSGQWGIMVILATIYESDRAIIKLVDLSWQI